MISSRRLAREWALKILYQSDVGKMSIEESEAAAMERLRKEFVQRGSRAAAGSILEEACLDAVTAHLTDALDDLDSAFELAARECLGRLFETTDYWERLDVDFTFSRQSFNALWEPPRHSIPIVLPIDVMTLPLSMGSESQLSAAQKSRLLKLLSWGRLALPEAAIRAYRREVQLARPVGARLKETQEFVQRRWRDFAHSIAARWPSTGHIVDKHTNDWMRVASFTLKLAHGVVSRRTELDASLQRLATGWAIDRQVSVDRNILRMAAFELAYMDSIPPSATINEAVELAKKYSTAESGRFVNGVLGAVVAKSGMDARAKSEGPNTSVLAEEKEPDIEVEELGSEEELAIA